MFNTNSNVVDYFHKKKSEMVLFRFVYIIICIESFSQIKRLFPVRLQSVFSILYYLKPVIIHNKVVYFN